MEGDIPECGCVGCQRHFNPLPPYGGRPSCRLLDNPQDIISIHSLRMEGDALLLGGFLENFTFQSTPSVWRETSRRRTFPDSQQRISIHSLRMEGDFVLFEVHHITCYFNPLPPYGGRRLIRYPFSRIHAFQSTPSVWRETPYIWLTRLQLRNFNPLPPYGGRLHNQLQSTATTRFQSTPSVWRETDTIIPIYLDGSISIHSLRMEGD